MGKLKKFILLNAGIVLVNIIVFSNYLLKVDLIGAGLKSTALGLLTILFSLLTFFIGTIGILISRPKPPKPIQLEKVDSPDDFVKALMQSRQSNTFRSDSEILIEQIRRVEKKKKTITDILLQHFDIHEMTYGKFEGIVLDGVNLFYSNVRSILNKISAFDELDYTSFKRRGSRDTYSRDIMEKKKNIYNEHISSVHDAVKDNEQILVKFDQILLETSKLNALETGALKNMSEMHEIDAMIDSIKWYK